MGQYSSQLLIIITREYYMFLGEMRFSTTDKISRYQGSHKPSHKVAEIRGVSRKFHQVLFPLFGYRVDDSTDSKPVYSLICLQLQR